MTLHLYVPALIVLGAAVLACISGAISTVANFGVPRPRPRNAVGFYLGILGFYGGAVAFLIGLGVLLAHI